MILFIKRNFTVRYIIAIVGLAVCCTNSAVGQVSYTGVTYSQNFDTLITSGTDQPWTNNVTLPGWHLFHQGLPSAVALTLYTASDGNVNPGSVYSYGTGVSTERALGAIGSGSSYWGNAGPGTVAGWMAIALTNATVNTYDEFVVGYDGEQWRNAGKNPHTMVLEYGFGATFNAVASWIAPGGNFDFTSPVNLSGNSAVDGNVAGLTAGRGGSITGLSWAPGQTLWVRYVERNDQGDDHGLGLDNFQFTAVPEPGSLGLLAGFGLLGAFVCGRRWKNKKAV